MATHKEKQQARLTEHYKQLADETGAVFMILYKLGQVYGPDLCDLQRESLSDALFHLKNLRYEIYHTIRADLPEAAGAFWDATHDSRGRKFCKQKWARDYVYAGKVKTPGGR